MILSNDRENEDKRRRKGTVISGYNRKEQSHITNQKKNCSHRYFSLLVFQDRLNENFSCT